MMAGATKCGLVQDQERRKNIKRTRKFQKILGKKKGKSREIGKNSMSPRIKYEIEGGKGPTYEEGSGRRRLKV